MYLDPQPQSQHHPQLACPKCGHNSVVQHGNVYACLNCNFHRNVSEPEANSDLLPILGVAVLVWFVVQLSFHPPTPPEPTPSIYSGNPLGQSWTDTN